MPEGPYENMGFPAGVAEELVLKVMRTCDPKNWKGPNGAKKPTDVDHEIMCSTVAQEVEVVAEEDKVEENSEEESHEDGGESCAQSETIESKEVSLTNNKEDSGTTSAGACAPPVIPVQNNSETYNGAEREKYCWSQTIMELGKEGIL